MKIQPKFLGLTLLLILLAAIAFGTSGVLAQQGGTLTPDPATPGTPGYGYGGHMHGMMGSNGQSDPVWAGIADALDMDLDALFTELQSGKTLVEIAEEHSVDIQNIYDAALTSMKDHMDTMVAAGYMTQAQEDARLTWMQDNIAQMPMFTETDVDPCPMDEMMGAYGSTPHMMSGMMGMRSGMHGGMMGGNGWNGMHSGHHGGWD